MPPPMLRPHAPCGAAIASWQNGMTEMSSIMKFLELYFIPFTKSRNKLRYEVFVMINHYSQFIQFIYATLIVWEDRTQI